jgi:hypothetical protein
MSRKTLIFFVWLIIGAAAAGQRGYFDNTPADCTGGATIAANLLIGPLNYLGFNPHVTCHWPSVTAN